MAGSVSVVSGVGSGVGSGWVAWDARHADRVVRAYRELRDRAPEGVTARLLLAHLPDDVALHPRVRGASVVAISVAAEAAGALDPVAVLTSVLMTEVPALAEVRSPAWGTDPRRVEATLTGPLRVLELADLTDDQDDDALDLLLLVLTDRSTCPLVLGSLGGGGAEATRLAPHPRAAGLAVALASFGTPAAHPADLLALGA